MAKKKPNRPKAVLSKKEPNMQAVREDVQQLFDAGAASSRPDRSLDGMMEQSRTQRSKVAVIVPLYGFWQDIPDNFLDEEVLDAALYRCRSYNHASYVLLPAEPQRISQPVAEVLRQRNVRGNFKGITMPLNSGYGDYIREGMRVALKETDAAYIVIQNPWVVLQDHSIDQLIDRVNVADNAPVICGYDMRTHIKDEEFLTYKPNVPRESYFLSLDFVGMPRYIADYVAFDTAMQTQPYLERDFFMQVSQKGFSVVSSERVPIFSLDVGWKEYFDPDEYAGDEALFLKKWKFIPGDCKKNV
jgi:hypothetical protein